MRDFISSHRLSIRWRELTKNYTFRAANCEELGDWVKALAFHIEKNKGTDWARVLPLANYFWKVLCDLASISCSSS